MVRRRFQCGLFVQLNLIADPVATILDDLELPEAVHPGRRLHFHESSLPSAVEASKDYFRKDERGTHPHTVLGMPFPRGLDSPSR